MAIVRTIGKNTIGDNNKMKVAMHNYEMSTHDLSFVFRSSMASGVLVPCMKIIAQKGDIWDIQMTNKTLTHPTLGPLFGAYKLQHFIFTCPIRLYNSWLHNNRTGIGMKMSDIKFPTFRGGAATTGSTLNQSSLMAYLGLRGTRSTGTTTQGLNAIPLLSYIDIFKNYFANTQEDKFYMVSGQRVRPESLIFRQGNTNIGIAGIPGTTKTEGISLNSAGKVLAVTSGGTITEPNNGWASFWQNVLVTITEKGTQQTKTLYQLTSDGTSSAITLDNISTSGATITSVSITTTAMDIIFPANKINLTQFPLTIMDELRDLILQTAGNKTLVVNGENAGAQQLTYNMIASRFQNLGGLLLKTYDSDIFQNWVKTDWIDGENGISAITAVAIQDGVITIDALNLQQKVYNMLNRIAISGGTYRDWLETVYTSGQYMERPETPVFEGGMSQIIEFEEVISKSATENQPLGDLAGRGVSSRPNGSGKLHFKVTEPSYIMGIMAITPLIDYSQGNDWDIVNLLTMDDLHKPALDGIGYEDSMNNQRAWWTRDLSTGKDTSAGKTVAWINYMTNFNKSFGNFASGNSESFMCLNRNYERNSTDNSISDLTTYIDPAKHNEIFADTDRGAQNFWVQTAFDIKVRRNISAKQIPNI